MAHNYHSLHGVLVLNVIIQPLLEFSALSFPIRRALFHACTIILYLIGIIRGRMNKVGKVDVLHHLAHKVFRKDR